VQFQDDALLDINQLSHNCKYFEARSIAPRSFENITSRPDKTNSKCLLLLFSFKASAVSSLLLD